MSYTNQKLVFFLGESPLAVVEDLVPSLSHQPHLLGRSVPYMVFHSRSVMDVPVLLSAVLLLLVVVVELAVVLNRRNIKHIYWFYFG